MSRYEIVRSCNFKICYLHESLVSKQRSSTYFWNYVFDDRRRDSSHAIHEFDKVFIRSTKFSPLQMKFANVEAL